jgi:hypothetical protein
MIRQGDVLLKKIDKIPDKTKLEKKNNILAYGEVTGHHHRFESPDVVTMVDPKTNTQYVTLGRDSLLEHEEHENLMIPKGIYEVVIQREFDMAQGVRQVVD